MLKYHPFVRESTISEPASDGLAVFRILCNIQGMTSNEASASVDNGR